jgi:hypothetical protein
MSLVDYKKDIKKPEDWYTVSQRAVLRHGGRKLIESNGGSLLKSKLFRWNVVTV